MDFKVTLFRKFFWRFWWSVYGLLAVPYTRSSARGHQIIPQEGKLLLVGNHITPLDPFWAAFYAYRRVHFMASAHLFRFPLIRWPLYQIGAFPKAKYTKDAKSMEALFSYNEQDECVSLFPEGQRSWNGRTEPMLPGIGRLIKRLDAPVIFVRLLTAYHWHPRWATYARSVNVRLEYSEPVHFPKEMSDDEIQAEVDRRLYVDADDHDPGQACFGFRLAWGLPTFLWACPQCYTQEGLGVDPDDGDVVMCRSCQRRWRLDVALKLHPLTPDTLKLTVATAHDRLVANFGEHPVADGVRFELDRTALEGEDVVLAVLSDRDAEGKVIARGKARLTDRKLEIQGKDGTLLWEKTLTEITAISLEVKSRLTLRTDEGLFDFDPIGESRYKWGSFIGGHRRAMLLAEGKPITGQSLSKAGV